MATLEGIEAQLSALAGGFNEFKSDFKEWQKCINVDLNGNGKPGIKSRLQTLEEAQRNDDEEIEEIKKKNNAWDKIFDFIASPKGVMTIVMIILSLLGATGKVAFDKIEQLDRTMQMVAAEVEK